ncbi:MAG: DUF3014 domain-containing protein [Rubrivivax sp.]|nr:DUF3014 domain-containing protein [Rubrivivax sp.]
MKRYTVALLVGAGLLALGAAAWLLWPQPQPPQPLEVASTPLPVQQLQASAPPAVAAAEPLPDAAVTLPPLASSDALLKESLTELVGRAGVLGLLQTDGFVRRIVATVDNLPRQHAEPRLWPVNPTAGRFTVDGQGRIALDNGQRYAALVQLIEGVEPARAVALYRRVHPLLQQAYEELGYPGQRFHSRLIEVVDHLLATPQPSAPLVLTLTEIKGPIPSQRPWVRYEFADASLQQLSAGQRMLLRVGIVNQRRLMAWLRDFRAQLLR